FWNKSQLDWQLVFIAAFVACTKNYNVVNQEEYKKYLEYFNDNFWGGLENCIVEKKNGAINDENNQRVEIIFSTLKVALGVVREEELPLVEKFLKEKFNSYERILFPGCWLEIDLEELFEGMEV
ncbi:MAG: hypothetical protein ABIA74_06055, partial [bacterium]